MKPVNFSKDESKQFWLVSVPNSEVGPHGFDQLRSAVGGAGVVAKFKIPSLRVGSLDSLLALSEDLGRKDQFFEGVVNKIARQLRDLYTDPETGSNEGPSAGDRILAVNNGTSTPQELPFCAFCLSLHKFRTIGQIAIRLISRAAFCHYVLPPSAQASHNNHVWGSLCAVGLDSYLSTFEWDEAKYKLTSPLKDVIDAVSTVRLSSPTASSATRHVALRAACMFEWTDESARAHACRP